MIEFDEYKGKLNALKPTLTDLGGARNRPPRTPPLPPTKKSRFPIRCRFAKQPVPNVLSAVSW